MKTWLKIFFGGLLALGTAAVALAQQPVMTVGITKIDVLNGGFVTSLTLVSGGTGLTNGLAQSIVTLNGGGGSGATATADVVGGSVTALHVTAGGSGYFNPPTVLISGGTTPATATAVLGFTPLSTFNPPNEAFGSVSNFINISALATGTFPAGGFTYAFKVDGTTIGTATPNPPNGSPGVVSWQPPQPGAYFITVTASDGANTATSLPIRYFATGTIVNSPVTNTLVPVGSSVVIKADATGAQGFVQQIQFYDNGAAIGSPDTTLPYSLIYTPAGAAGSTHLITAQATDNTGALLAASASITLKLVSPILPVATCVISSPANNAAIPIGPPISVAVDAHSTSGSINKVELYVNGVLFGTNTNFPYTFSWSPTVVGNYNLVALAYDDKNNVVASTTSTTPSTTPAPNLVYVASPPTVTITSPTSGSTVTGGATQISANATDSNGYTITSVQFFQDGIFIGQANSPSSGSTYTISASLTSKSVASILTAVATDSIGLTSTSPSVSVTVTSGGTGGGGTVIGLPPVVSITAPTDGSSVLVGAPVTLSANASDPDGNIVSVQFFANNGSLATITSYPYNSTWTPTSLGKYTIVAKAIDNSGNAVTSAAVTVSVSANQPPTVTLTNPSKAATIPAGTPFTLSATASDSDGTVASVKFFANGILVGTTGASPPYTAVWTPSGAGNYAIYAQATDNSNNITNSATVTVTVNGNTPPTVTLTSPAPGSTVAVGTALSLSATASDSDGLIASVQFFANGVSLGTSKTPPYTASFTPNAEGVYALTAVALDNAGGITTSAAISVLAISSNSTAANLVYIGNYLGGFEAGRFAAINLGGQAATFMAYSNSTSSAAKTYYYPGLAVDASGGISDPSGANRVLGTLQTGGSLTGSFNNSALLFASQTLTPASTTVPAGYYRGSISGKSSSDVVGIVAIDAEIFVYASDGKNSDVGGGTITSAGTFSFKTTAGNTIAGTVDPVSGFITATISGNISGNIQAASSGGGAVSDGSLRNLSTRGQVGTGANVLITGFVVGGTASKNVLIRAVGPTLSTLGITSPLADPQLQVYNSAGAPITGAFNDNWNASDAASMASVGAFALPVGSKDAALVTSLAPGVYTTQVSGVGGATGVALIEFYDLDNPSPFSTQKVMNVSTRGQVGTGQSSLIAGFVINGAAPKKVLIRAVGGQTLATLANLPVGNVLADPFITLQRQVNGAAVFVRENDNWEMGNDASLVVQAGSRVGAFPLVSGSKDAVLLITLPPGTYTAQVTGVGSTTGVALVEVYEVPVP
jgi:sulfur relay (sulfurtransferase) complex TusBCD TusD component (DsrE family)